MSHLADKYLAHSCLPHIVSVLENANELFAFQYQDPHKGLTTMQMLEMTYSCYSEGVDYCNERVFETSHPYPRGEVSMKESFHFPGAIAVQVDIDKRSQTETNSDVLIINSSDHIFWVNDNFGTQFRYMGKPSLRYPIMLLGSKISIEFRAYSHAKKRKTGNAEDLDTRWGFRCVIHPVYGEPSTYMQGPSRTQEKLNEVLSSIGGEEGFKHWIYLLDTLTFLGGNMAKTLIQGTEENADEESVQKVVGWHIFSGGLQKAKDRDALVKDFLEDREEEEARLREEAELDRAIEAEDAKEPVAEEEEKKESQSEEKKEADGYVFHTEDAAQEVEAYLQKVDADDGPIWVTWKAMREAVRYPPMYMQERKN